MVEPKLRSLQTANFTHVETFQPATIVRNTCLKIGEAELKDAPPPPLHAANTKSRFMASRPADFSNAKY